MINFFAYTVVHIFIEHYQLQKVHQTSGKMTKISESRLILNNIFLLLIYDKKNQGKTKLIDILHAKVHIFFF